MSRQTRESVILAEVERIGRDVVKPVADTVDREARFPHEAIDALKQARVLSAGVSQELGGAGCDVGALSRICTSLARHCGSTALIVAMHFIKVESVLRFGGEHEEFRGYLRELAKEQRLVASVTSEVGIGGDLRRSDAALEPSGTGFRLVKEGSCVSYGAHADDLILTCRRTGEASASDQVLVLARRGDFDLEQRGDWDALGMRGTCSPPFTISAQVAAWQVFNVPFSDIAARSMVPSTHILWSSVWLGIAKDAVARARAQIRQRRRGGTGRNAAAARRLAHTERRLQLMRSGIESLIVEFLALSEEEGDEGSPSLGFGLRVNQLKLNSSELAVEIVSNALLACGFSGYLNDSTNSITRQLRDIYSAPLMIGNDRVLEHNAALELISGASEP